MIKNLIKYVSITTLVISTFIFFSSGNKSQKKPSMTLVRGLKPAISEFTLLEQQFITLVAEKLNNNGFPVDQLTRVHLKKRILTPTDYYAYNEITFFINPGVYRPNEFNWGIQNIGVGWDDSTLIKTPDGGFEFEIGHKPKQEDLTMTFYRLQDAYSYGKLLENHNQIIQRINDLFLTSNLEEIKPFTSQGIVELLSNYLMVITADNENKNVFEMTLRRIEHELINFDHYNTLYKQYTLRLNLNTSSIEILNSFDPTFFPSPATNPDIPFTK